MRVSKCCYALVIGKNIQQGLQLISVKLEEIIENKLKNGEKSV